MGPVCLKTFSGSRCYPHYGAENDPLLLCLFFPCTTIPDLGGAREQTQGSVHARQVLYPLSYIPVSLAPLPVSLSNGFNRAAEASREEGELPEITGELEAIVLLVLEPCCLCDSCIRTIQPLGSSRPPAEMGPRCMGQ